LLPSTATSTTTPTTTPATSPSSFNAAYNTLAYPCVAFHSHHLPRIGLDVWLKKLDRKSDFYFSVKIKIINKKQTRKNGFGLYSYPPMIEDRRVEDLKIHQTHIS
jgi:hypothetical protein